MNQIDVEIVKTFDGTYYANVIKNGELVEGLPEYISYRALKQAIKDTINFEILPHKALKFKQYQHKQYAYFSNYNKNKLKGE